MIDDPSYKEYVDDESFLNDYNEYQRKYAIEPRKSDEVLLRFISDVLAARDAEMAVARLLDIGCSTGNLLRHIRKRFPKLILTGGELAQSSLEECKADPTLAGITFERLDMLALPPNRSFDIILANAVAFCLSHQEYKQAMKSVWEALAPGGTYMAFELLHRHNQDLKITETTMSHPMGMNLYVRPLRKVQTWLEEVGFASVRFEPFVIPIDLPHPGFDGDPVSYTIKNSEGERMCFRGTLYQPWCHMIAVKR